MGTSIEADISPRIYVWSDFYILAFRFSFRLQKRALVCDSISQWITVLYVNYCIYQWANNIERFVGKDILRYYRFMAKYWITFRLDIPYLLEFECRIETCPTCRRRKALTDKGETPSVGFTRVWKKNLTLVSFSRIFLFQKLPITEKVLSTQVCSFQRILRSLSMQSIYTRIQYLTAVWKLCRKNAYGKGANRNNAN